MSKAKYIFITGGVSSSLGKGVSAASIGSLLEAYEYKVTLQKLDPYLNIDPGTMSPQQHGEVYVTDDGAETDLDLGYYERFTNSTLTAANSVSTGQIYDTVIRQEREGKFLGATVQIIPHITNEIKKRILILEKQADEDIDFVIVEIGGTVGDIESVPFLESIRQLRLDIGHDNVLYIHVTLLPKLNVSGEIKTKPTQHSVKELLKVGIQPDILICRAESFLTDEIKQKIALFCNVSPECVISAPDTKTTIYEVPLIFKKEGIDRQILRFFHMKDSTDLLGENWSPIIQSWNFVVNTLKNPEISIKIAVVGKYMTVSDAYRSIYEALSHGGIVNNCFVEFVQVDACKHQDDALLSYLNDVSGILVPGGFGDGGHSSKLNAITFARENKIPFLGICLGMHCATIEFARNVIGWKNANSTEFNSTTSHPVIHMMGSQINVSKKGGTMHLGAFPIQIQDNSLLYRAYQKNHIQERYRRRFEFNMKYQNDFITNGMIPSAYSQDGTSLNALELSENLHPWFVTTQFHPEFKSSPLRPHPLFKDFIANAILFSQQALVPNTSQHIASAQ